MLPLLLALIAVFHTPLPGGAAQLDPFEAKVLAHGSERAAALIQGQTVLVRWRCGATLHEALARMEKLASRLNDLALAGFSPADVQVAKAPAAAVPRNSAGGGRPTPPDAVLKVKGEVLLTVTARHAAEFRSTPWDLVERWAQKLRDAVAEPYLMLGKLQVSVPVGETRSIAFGGRPQGPVSAFSGEPEIAVVSLNAAARTLTVRGVRSGTTTVGVQAGQAAATATAEVRPWAAKVTSPVTVQVTGPQEFNPWVEQALKFAVLQGLEVEPGATAQVRRVSAAGPMGTALVTARGPGYFSLERSVEVHIAPVTVPVLSEPVRVVLSNEPESIGWAQPLSSTHLSLQEPIHYLWHHVGSGSENLQIVVRLCNIGDTTAIVHVIGADGGPNADEVFTGHAVMRRFFHAWRERAGNVLWVYPGQQCELSRLPLPPGKVVSGLARIALLEGRNVYVEAVACPENEPAADPLAAPPVVPARDPSYRLELPGYKRVELRAQVGRGWGFLRIGKTPEELVRHPRLRGEYGVVHDVDVVFTGGDGRMARLELALRSGGGPARAVVEVEGQVIETGLLAQGMEQLLWKETTTAASRSLRVRMIPQSGSNYPVHLIARGFVK